MSISKQPFMEYHLFIYSLSAEEKLWLTVEKIIHETSERMAILVVTQPFQVLAVRCMAQFVGGENKYNGILSGFGEIYRENGILGIKLLFATEIYLARNLMMLTCSARTC